LCEIGKIRLRILRWILVKTSAKACKTEEGEGNLVLSRKERSAGKEYLVAKGGKFK